MRLKSRATLLLGQQFVQINKSGIQRLPLNHPNKIPVMWQASLRNHAIMNPAIAICVGGTLQWRHNRNDSVSNHQPLDRLFRHRSKKASKLRVTGLCAGNSSGTGEFPAQMASYAENVSIWWRHHESPLITKTELSCQHSIFSKYDALSTRAHFR